MKNVVLFLMLMMTVMIKAQKLSDETADHSLFSTPPKAQTQPVAVEEVNPNLFSVVKHSADCVAEIPLPMWSWGFAKSCCDVFPDKLGAGHSFFEHGDLTSKHYFKRSGIQHGQAVYVATPDLPLFIADRFLSLPADARIVLVTGSEDIGTPFELFHPNRVNFFDYKMSALWPMGQKITMEQFLLDKRLFKWFAQNYDLTGCNAYTCSDVVPDTPEGRIMMNKMVPIPIGLDFHSVAKRDTGSHHKRVCEQRHELDVARKSTSKISFADRKLAVLAEFDCNFDQTKIGVARSKTRGEICAMIQAKNPAFAVVYNAKSENKTRLDFWKAIGEFAFSLAPAGFGMDTHRLWEILMVDTVPITLKSSLDRLYEQFPVILLDKWSDLAAPNALQNMRTQIQLKFGQEPFRNATMKRKLSATYWLDLVNEEKNKTQSSSGGVFL